MKKLITLVLFLLGWLTPLTQSFVLPPSHGALRAMTLSAKYDNNDDDDAEDTLKQEQESGLPLLPYFGSSSQTFFDPFDGTLPHLKPENDPDADAKPFVANRKFELQYTCNICDTRNCHKVSRVAYRKGVVIATCKGCGTQHLIADNLGFTNLWNKEGTIEEYFANKGMEESVTRVSKDVFHLEKMLGHDSDSGSIMGDDGKPAME